MLDRRAETAECKGKGGGVALEDLPAAHTW
jgi:hypothetical protein